MYGQSIEGRHVLQGIIGDTYERFTVGQEAFNPNSTYFLPEDVSCHRTCVGSPVCSSAGVQTSSMYT